MKAKYGILVFFLTCLIISATTIKFPNVAGTFYVDNAKLLNQQISEYIEKAKVTLPRCAIVGILVPHAGYIYSGETAGYSFKALKTNNYAQYKRIFILGPSHYFRFEGLALPDFIYYKIPTKDMVIDEKTVRKLASYKFFKINNKYFYKEHSVEVELPFINYTYPGVKIVPIIVGNIDKKMISTIVSALKPYLKDSLFVISSDLMHYKKQEIVKRADSKLLNLVIEKKPEILLKKDLSGEIEACGIFPLYIFLNLIKDDDNIEGQILYMGDSGKANNNYDKIVGYGSVVFYKKIAKKK